MVMAATLEDDRLAARQDEVKAIRKDALEEAEDTELFVFEARWSSPWGGRGIVVARNPSTR